MGNFLYVTILLILFSNISVSTNVNFYLSLNYTSIMQARKNFMALDTSNISYQEPLDTSNISYHSSSSSYSLPLYHRDVFEKSEFKDYDSLLEARLARCMERTDMLYSMSEYSNSNSNNNISKHFSTVTPITPINTTVYSYTQYGEIVIPLWIGSALRRQLLLVDTGSRIVWWQCAPCEKNKCFRQKNDVLYDSTESTTFQQINCLRDRQSCFESGSVYCSTRDTKCFYEVWYGVSASTLSTSGFLSYELITFSSILDYARIIFGCAKNQMKGSIKFPGMYSGIAGFGGALFANGLEKYSLPSQLGAHVFGFCIPTPTSGQPSTLYFYQTPWKTGIKASLTRNARFPAFYYISDLDKIMINNRVVPIDPSNWSFGPNEDGGIFVDSGAYVTSFPYDVYIKFRDVFRSEVKGLTMAPNGTKTLDTCYWAGENVNWNNFPTVSFYFKASVLPLYVRHQQVMVLYRERYCLGFRSSGKNFSIIGSNVLQTFGLTFHLSYWTLTFSPDACL